MRAANDVFISHIHEDARVAKATARFVKSKLPTARAFVSSDSGHLRLGDDWLETIRYAFISAKVVIALFSPEAVERPWVNFEAGGAWFDSAKTLIPVCIGDDLKPHVLPRPYSNLMGIRLEVSRNLAGIPDRSESPWLLVKRIAQVLEIRVPKRFPGNDADLDRLDSALDQWRERRRALAAYKRMTGNKSIPDELYEL